MRICDTEGCNNKHKAKGLCAFHYKRTDEYRASTKKYNNSGQRKEYMTAYCKTEKNKEYEKTSKRKVKCKAFDNSLSGKISREKRRKTYNEKHPDRFQARRMAQQKIKRQECEVINCMQLGERHHDDYSKPLDVRFLCKEHHSELSQVAC